MPIFPFVLGVHCPGIGPRASPEAAALELQHFGASDDRSDGSPRSGRSVRSSARGKASKIGSRPQAKTAKKTTPSKTSKTKPKKE